MQLSIRDLRTESLCNPRGIDRIQPKLSWKLAADYRGAKQTAYQIIVAEGADPLLDDAVKVWDSGKVHASDSVHIRYEGEPLKSDRDYYWRVKVWDRRDQASAWSEAAMWSTGLFSRNEWVGKWIGLKSDIEPDLSRAKPCVYVRKSFTINKRVKRAVIYSTALGLYKLYLDGRPIGDDVFAPEWTDYNIRLQYQTYDVTPWLTEGDHALSSVLGHGWYSGRIGKAGFQIYGYDPQLRMQMHLEYEDGTKEVLATDESWRASFGPIVSSDFQLGEVYDARLELPDWQLPACNEHNWEHAHVYYGYKGWLVAQTSQTVQVVKRMKPKAVWKTKENTYIVDMGQNMTGWIQAKLTGAANQEIVMRYAEVLDQQGNLYQDNLRAAVQTDRYIFAKDATVEYEPQFTFHGFRYVEISGAASALEADHIVGKAVYSNTPEAGDFECSNPQLNRLFHNIFWTQRSNFVSVPTDCPQRDERLGWLGDAQLFFRTASYNADVYAFFRKWLQDIRDAQLKTGCYTDIAPHVRHSKVYPIIGSAGWADAGIIIPWEMYPVYADPYVLEENYDNMAKWIQYNLDIYPDLIVDQLPQFGDWLSLPTEDDTEKFETVGAHVNATCTTPYDVFSTAYFANSVKLMAQIAATLNRKADAEYYNRLFESVKHAFNDAFVQPDGRIKGNTQTIYAMALHMDLLPESLRPKALEYLIHLLEKRNWRIAAGIHGIKYVFLALTAHGRQDIVYRLLLQEAYPSWLYMIKNGATTIWERWDGFTEERGFQSTEMNSMNHYALGSIGQWMYEAIAGIAREPGRAGFKHFEVRPVPGGNLDFVKCRYDSLYGPIRVEWEAKDTSFKLKVDVPANCTAKIYVPNPARRLVTESGQPAAAAEGVQSLGEMDGSTVFLVESGSYTFEVS